MLWTFGAAILVAATLYMGPAPRSAEGQDEVPSGESLRQALALEEAVVSAIARAERSVVAIAVVTPQVGLLADWPQPVDPFGQLRGLGSSPALPNGDFIPAQFGTGVVIDRRGLILTTYHALDSAQEHWVTTADRRALKATIVAADPRSDLAVLSVDAADLTPISLGHSESLRKGQFVISLGNPYAIARDGRASASWGIVANIARKAADSTSSSQPASRADTLYQYGGLIQTDARLNLGTSGGPLINLRGEMVGLATSLAAVAGFDQGAGYAAPADATFRRAVRDLVEGKEVEYGFLGVSPQDLSSRHRAEGLVGAEVADIVDGAPAAEAGLRPGDVVTHVDDQPIDGRDGLMLNVGREPPGKQLRLTVLREGLPRRFTVTLVKNVRLPQTIATNEPPAWRGMRVDYATASPDFSEQLRLGNVDPEGSLWVASVDENSPAWEAGLRSGTFISHVGGVRVRLPEEFRSAVAAQAGTVQILTSTADAARSFFAVPPEGAGSE
jgi:S1-C subfamily serine protease